MIEKRLTINLDQRKSLILSLAVTLASIILGFKSKLILTLSIINISIILLVTIYGDI